MSGQASWLAGWAVRGARGPVVAVRLVLSLFVIGLGCGVASAQAATLYAYADGAGTPSGCPSEQTTSNGCSLGTALSDAAAGDTVLLATPSASGSYVGNWSIGTSGTSAGAPVTIDGSGVSGATLDGNNGVSGGCSTGTCDGPVLSVTNNMFLAITGVTVQNGNNTALGVGGGLGGGLRNDAGGTVTITGSTFIGNQADEQGGAIANGGGNGSGTMTITDSILEDNSSVAGGAISNGGTIGQTSVTVSRSTFSGNSAAYGGAVVNGYGGSTTATAAVSGSTFTANTATADGGAIDNADPGGSGTVTVANSTLSGDDATDGSEIATSDNSGNGTLVLSESTLAPASGAAVTAGHNGGTGRVFVAGDLFAAGCQQPAGTWTDQGYNAGVDSTCFHGGSGDVDAGSITALDLGALASNGGPTKTIAVGAKSKAIGIVPNPTTVTLNSQQVALCPGTDQRGHPRPGTGETACDAGAFEVPINTLYAYEDGAGAPSGCPSEVTTSSGCSLGTALSGAAAGDTVMLATPGAGGQRYVGNWSIGTTGTSAGAPVTIYGGPNGATLDGNNGSSAGCSTPACDGPALTVSNGMFLAIKDVTIENAHNTSSLVGGGLQNDAGGTVTISGSTFSGDSANFGGALANGTGASGTVTITDSTFTGNSAARDGGAIDNADAGGSGTVTVSDSTFSGDSATDGAEIDTGDLSGSGVLVLSGSTFVPPSGNAVTAGGGHVFVAGDLFAGACQQNGATWSDLGYNAGIDSSCLNGGSRDAIAGSLGALHLGSLSSNGGATQTVALNAGSKAIGIVPAPTTVTLNSQQVPLCTGSTVDQRGDPRPGTGAGACDAGAFEVQSSTLYAYANGTSATSGCPKTAVASERCSLGRALALAVPGDTVALASNGASVGGLDYVGNWSVGTSGTSAGSPVTIDGSQVSGATLDGNHGSSSGCSTPTCDGPVLSVTNNMFLTIRGVTIQHGNNTGLGIGAGIQNNAGGTVAIFSSNFEGNAGVSGGAIGNGDDGSGTVSVTNSTFEGNTALDGGAIDNGGQNGSGTLKISGSTFTGNTAGSDGGAIDSADEAGLATVTVSDSTFSGDKASDNGSEIDTGNLSAGGTLVLSASTLAPAQGSAVTAGRNNLEAQVFVAGDVFAAGCQQNGDTWTDQGYNAGVDSSCFSGGSGDVDAGSVAALDLGSLASNGGPTPTIALKPASPAANIVPKPATVTLNGSQVGLCPSKDQRGAARPGDGKARCDAGAYESQPAVPSVQITTPAEGGSYGEATPVEASFACADGTGGPGLVAGSAGCSGTVVSGSAIDTSTSGSHAFTVTATSRDGLTTTVTVHYTVPPASAPSVQITTPADGSSYAIGASVDAAYACAEGAGGPGLLTGTAGCDATVASGSPIDTSTAGLHAFTVTAVSADGLTTSDTVHYTVQSGPPAKTSPPAVTGNARTGQTLNCSTGDWSNTPGSFSYQWSRDGTPIVGATGATYTVQQLDEGTALTCTVTATNASGEGPPATSGSFEIPVPFVAGCPAATGSVSGTKLGSLRLGMTRGQAKHANRHSSTRGKAYEEFFCLTPRGVRVGYGSPKELKSLPKHERARYAARVIWISTSSAYYAIDGVRIGATVAAAGKRLRIGRVFVVGLNDWYLAPAGAATAVLKVRDGIVEEIGIGNKNLTKTRKAQRQFLTSFG